MQNKSYKIGIVGIGAVGSTLAYTLLLQGQIDELVLFSRHKERVDSEIQDLNDGQAGLQKKVKIYNAPLDKAMGCDIIVISIGNIKQLKAKGRQGELKDNQTRVEKIGKTLKNYKGIVINITNPCDYITGKLQELIPKAKVIGTGTVLDTYRLNALLGYPKEMVYITGYHGESQKTHWKTNTKRDIKLEEEVQNGVWKVLKGKEHSNFAISIVTANIINAIINDTKEKFTVSFFDGEETKSHIVKIGRNGVIDEKGIAI